VNTLPDLAGAVTNRIAEARTLRLADLQFLHRDDALFALTIMVAMAAVLLVLRSLIRSYTGRRGMVLPALIGSIPKPSGVWLVHLPLVLFLLGVPFFALALADPFTPLIGHEVSYPGRRIGIMLDASVSMRADFQLNELADPNAKANAQGAFFANIAAAEMFVKLRQKSKYRDLIGVVQFGNQAYVVMPFTSDYDNVLLSLSLIGDPEEYGRFPAQGTLIANAINEAVGLFRAFNFLDASGNMLVLFSDGEDSTYSSGTKTLDQIIASAIEAKIPVYLVRTNFGKGQGQVVQDSVWSEAIQRTGGKLLPAGDEKSLIQAINELNSLATGTISFKQYTSQEPRFTVFALVAVGFWTVAAALKLGIPRFQKLS
jgi:hypothetical protein